MQNKELGQEYISLCQEFFKRISDLVEANYLRLIKATVIEETTFN